MAIKKVKDIKSGQRVYRVWGYPVRPENFYSDDPGYGLGPGGQAYFIHVEACLPLGKRRRFYPWHSQMSHAVSGTLCNRYFHKKERGEQFRQEILQGLHPEALYEMEEHASRCDDFEEGLSLFFSGEDEEDYGGHYDDAHR